MFAAFFKPVEYVLRAFCWRFSAALMKVPKGRKKERKKERKKGRKEERKEGRKEGRRF